MELVFSHRRPIVPKVITCEGPISIIEESNLRLQNEFQLKFSICAGAVRVTIRILIKSNNVFSKTQSDLGPFFI